MFFDSNGYLFSGGDGITVFRPDGTISYNNSNLTGTLTYDPADNEVLVPPPYGSSTGTVYNATAFETVPEPSTLALLAAGTVAGLAAWRRRKSK